AGLGSSSLADRVRSVVSERLSGDFTPEGVAAGLGMSSRSLQRKLQELGTSYASILNETRRDLATRYLMDARYSVTEVAFLVGFEDASAFARAFRRWTGRSPSAYRAGDKPAR